MAIKKTKGEQTRQMIIAAAAPIFNRRGYEGSSLSDLMEATGLQKGGIYRHFESKEHLAAEAFDYAWEAARECRMRHLDASLPGLQRLKQAISNFVEVTPPVPGGCPVLNTAIDSDDGNPVLRERAGKALRWWSTHLQGMLKDAARMGEVRAGVDPQAVAHVVIASLEGALMISRLERSRDALRQVQQHLERYIDHEVAI